ncbi:hypothetical protein JVU11DRAFT_223 [Chiua virens]|nr:hypothetical protein JVU11DRAFT_223 [Chiua virens]
MGKLQPEQYYSPDPMIFSGVIACVTDLVAADLEVLSAGITALGGQWRIGLARDVIHLFAQEVTRYSISHSLCVSDTHAVVFQKHYTWLDPPILRPGMTLHLSDGPLATDGRRNEPAGDTVGDAGDGTQDEVDHLRVWAGRRIFLSPHSKWEVVLEAR